MTRERTRQLFERIACLLGILLLGIWLVGYFGGRIASKAAIDDFKAQKQELRGSAEWSPHIYWPVDVKLWSDKRIREYQSSLSEYDRSPQALLRLQSIRLEVPVFEGTDDFTLNRGAGRIAGSARIGSRGNVGIAAHRDGFFRGLKDVSIGDRIELETRTNTQIYVIDSIKIVSPSDVDVLKSGQVPSITLVTCYPFYFVGDAPQRFIAHASLVSEGNGWDQVESRASNIKENAK